MRQISSDLQAVQQVRSPRARVTVTVEAQGMNPSVPALAWSEVVGNHGQSVFRPTTAVGLANGNILKFQADASNLRMVTVSNPHLAASWSSLTPTTLVASTMLAVCALRVPESSTVRLWMINSNNNVQYTESSNNGATWGSAVTVYSGGDAVRDLVVSYIDNGTVSNGPWFFGFSTLSGVTYTPRFGYYDGANWVTHAYESDWRAAGVDAYGAPTAEHRCLVFKARGVGASKLRVVEKLGGSYSNGRELDQTQAGYFGIELAYYRYCQLPEAGQTGCMLAVVGESAFGAGAHLGVGGLITSSDASSTTVLVDEPIIFPAIACVSSQPYACLCRVPSAIGTGFDDLYLVGDTVVYRGAA